MAYGFTRGRLAVLLALSTALSACSTDALVPPAEIDGSARVGAIRPAPPSSVATLRREPVVEAYAMPATVVPPAASASVLAIPEDGVTMDEGLGVNAGSSPRVVGLAEEQSLDIAEGRTDQPVVDGIGTDSPVLLAPRDIGSAPGWQAGAVPRSLPAQGRQVAMLKPDNPAMRDFSPRSEAPAIMPASEQACRAELRKLGVRFRDIARIDGGPSCGIDYPLKLSGLPGGVAVNETTLNCQVTLAFAKWVRQEVVPSARARYLSGVAKIQTMGGYSCRKMNSRARNPWSEHARGNAVDIGTIVLKNGKEIDVRKKGFFAFREKGLLKAVRSDSCKYFSTVLGPGSDPDHWNHFHFDLRSRKTGYRHCD